MIWVKSELEHPNHLIDMVKQHFISMITQVLELGKEWAWAHDSPYWEGEAASID